MKKGGEGADKEFAKLNTRGGSGKVENLVNTKVPIPKYVIRNPYHTKNMEKMNATKVHLEKQTLEEKMKDFKVKTFTDQKVNVASSSGKGKLAMIYEEDLNPSLTE